MFPAIFHLDDRDRIPVRAICHVMDVSDIKHPKEVAQYEVPEGGSHNFWAANDMLYEGYYSGGARVLDISGELRGDLYRQGREIARFWTGDSKGFRPNLPFTWGGQPCSVACDSPLLNSLMYFNDIHSGLWITKLGETEVSGIDHRSWREEERADDSLRTISLKFPGVEMSRKDFEERVVLRALG